MDIKSSMPNRGYTNLTNQSVSMPPLKIARSYGRKVANFGNLDVLNSSHANIKFEHNKMTSPKANIARIEAQKNYLERLKGSRDASQESAPSAQNVEGIPNQGTITSDTENQAVSNIINGPG